MTPQNTIHDGALSLKNISATGCKPERQVKAQGHDTVPVLTPVDGGLNAWGYLIAACIMEAVVWGFPLSYGIFLDEYLKDPRIAAQTGAHTLLPLIGTLSNGLVYLTGPIITPYCHRIPHLVPTLLWAGLLICAFSLVTASYTQSVIELLIFQGVLYGIGGALLYNPTFSFLSEWFVARRGMATGVMYAGTGFGGVVLPLLLPQLLRLFGISTTLRILAILIVVLIAPALFFVKSRFPLQDALAKAEQMKHEGKHTEGRIWMRHPAVWLILGANTMQGLGHFVPFIWLPTFCRDIGMSTTTASIALSLLNGFAVVSPPIVGILSDRLNAWLLGIVSISAASLCIFVFWGLLAFNTVGIFVFVIAFGLAAGGWSTLWPRFMHPFGRDDVQLTNKLLGLCLFTRGLGNVLSTPLSTALQNASPPEFLRVSKRIGFVIGDGKYFGMIVFVGAVMVAGAVLMASAWIFTPPVVDQSEKDIRDDTSSITAVDDLEKGASNYWGSSDSVCTPPPVYNPQSNKSWDTLTIYSTSSDMMHS